LPLIARVNLTELQKQREKEMQDKEISILSKTDYTKRILTIRLYYVSLELFNRYGSNELKIGQTYEISSPFRLPPEMSIEDACKVVSYLSDKVEKENNLEPACEKSVIMVSNLLQDYGFEKVETKDKGHYHAVSEYIPYHKIRTDFPVCDKIEGVVDLFTVGGDFDVFKKTDLHGRYFNWYSEDITQQEIVDIYKKIRREYLLPDTTLSNTDKTL